MRSFPPLKALLAFSVVAETKNVTYAAKKLCVTQSAVSQQLKILEDDLGVQLLVRKRNRIELTPAGERYALKIKLAFDDISQATAEFRATTINSYVITVNMLTAFAIRWLIPRLAQFQKAYPDFELRISTPSKTVDFSNEEIDAAIYLGDEAWWPEESVEFLFRDKIIPVCSPQLITDDKAKLETFKLLNVPIIGRKEDWPTWLKAASLPPLKNFSVLQFQTLDQALEAAINGVGVAMGNESLIKTEMQSGSLITPWPLSIPAPNAYYLVYPKEKTNKHHVFSSWLRSQI